MSQVTINKDKVQRFGRFLTKMVMPNIGAFIAWGLITACFNPNGWLPNEDLNRLVTPMITYLLPMLIGYTGGRMIFGHRGGVVGSIATMGVIVGTDIPMFIGAMIVGPLGAAIIKRIDGALKSRVPMGFEMLTSNFSAGIVGFFIALIGYKLVGPTVEILSRLLENGVYGLVRHNLLFLVSLIIEPGKILFLNNAINHGILGNLGVQQASETGKSVFFLLETNPGPGLGILLATFFHSKDSIKQTVPGAAVIHFFGGIHEIYFPYVLASPLLFIAVIFGGMSGVMTMNLLNLGLVATPSPGSIFAILAMTPKQDFLSVLLAVGVSTVVTFAIAKVILARTEDLKTADSEADFELELELESEREAQSGEVALPLAFANLEVGYRFSKIVFACDTGMGSSAMGAALVGKMMSDAGIVIEVENAPIDDIPADADLVITFEALKGRALHSAPNAIHVGIHDFLYKPQYEALIQQIKPYCRTEEGKTAMTLPIEILMKDNIQLNRPSVSKEEAICYAGELLLQGGYVEADYIQGMLAREAKFTTYIGNGVAIPHGENEVKDRILASGIVVIQYPNGIDFGGGNEVKLVIGIAGKGNEHIQLLSNIAEAIEDEFLLEKMCSTTDINFIYDLLS